MIEGPDARGMVPRYVQSVRVFFIFDKKRKITLNYLFQKFITRFAFKNRTPGKKAYSSKHLA